MRHNLINLNVAYRSFLRNLLNEAGNLLHRLSRYDCAMVAIYDFDFHWAVAELKNDEELLVALSSDHLDDTHLIQTIVVWKFGVVLCWFDE